MPEKDIRIEELQAQLEEANAQLEAMQLSTADAEARAASSEERAAQAEASAASLADLSAQLETAKADLQGAAARYRQARLASNPDIPPEMVPETADFDEIERSLDAAEQVVGQLKERLAKESGGVRAPAGSPARRGGPDLSGLSPAEKIRLGLQAR